MKKHYFLTLILLLTSFAQAQVLHHKRTYTRQDTLRGSNTQYRDWWDVKHYDLTIDVDEKQKKINGVNRIKFEVTKPNHHQLMQIDLQEPMQITQMLINGKQAEFTREGNVFFVKTAHLLKPKKNELKIYFNGHPHEAVNAPWDGGWIFTKDEKGRPWLSVAVQGLGASAWFPNKDYQGDEPDHGAKLEIIVAEGLTGVANGKLSKVKRLPNKKVSFTWEVKNPINNYNLIPSIGHYLNIKKNYKGLKGNLELNHYVLDYNMDKALIHFGEVEKMLQSFEDWFGPYPFYEDSFKLIESPHLGMEHQSGIAYGNKFMNGYLGSDLSGSGWGLKWDFIIVHEAGHEWFGNNITTNDVADMWVHEAFTAYAETLFVETHFGKKAAGDYVIGTRMKIVNDIPIVGVYGVQQEGSGDMYYKGANMIHTFRTWLNDDEKFKNILRALNKDFYHQTVDGKDIEAYLEQKSGLDLKAFFEQYLRTTQIPLLETKIEHDQLQFRYTQVVEGFSMPLRLANGATIYPTTNWQTFNGKKSDFNILKSYLVEWR
ncbi:M1 family metallopeptidase [Vaginella massiliensis]|uniref:M1 family metallopeptidase n=1 Tax=Vaginella massiliensis TaxID=1816680 RepID=UPI0008384204|nr:M1 family metallopeptidase [Vaginella massiliensis]